MTDSAIRSSLSVLGTLAFCIPGPWGIVTSAALQAIGFLLPTDGRDPLLDAVKQSTSDIETYIAQHGLAVDKASIVSIKNWLSITDKMTDLYTNPAQLQGRIRSIDTLDDVLSTADKTCDDLKAYYDNPKGQPAGSAYTFACSALASYIGLRLAVAQCLSLRVSLWQALAAIYVQTPALQDKAKDAQDNIESTFEDMVAYIQQYLSDPVSAIAAYKTTLDALKAFRIAQVDALADDVSPWAPNYHFTDQGDPQTKYVWNYTTDWGSFVGDQAAVQATAQVGRGTLIAKLRSDADSFAADIMSLLNSASDIWNRAPKLPAPPSTAPSVDTFDTSWQGAWQSPGAYVAYKFYYLSLDGRTVESPQGPTDAKGLVAPMLCSQSGSECPKVSFPLDPSGLAVARMLIRTVSTDAQGTNSKDYVVPVPNMLDEFYDLWPGRVTNVAPNAVSAPLISAWACDRTVSGANCTWPPNPAPVRYRYKYTRGAMQSLAWSPWSTVQAPSGSTIDSDGYVTDQLYYCALMQVPEISGCDFILQRQFKGASILTIKHTATKAALGSAPTIWLEDSTGP